MLFLLTPLREGRPRCFFRIRGIHYFYSRPCGRGDVDEGEPAAYIGSISTHAPAGGATEKIPAPAGGAVRFLLTPLREGRRLTLEQLEMRVHISTHAPAGGATFQSSGSCLRTTISTHAPAGGATLIAAAASGSSLFLLTPLREGRPRIRAFCLAIRTFLLTPLREGRRAVHPYPRRQILISTHAPAGGATVRFYRSRRARMISTHAPAGGATNPAVKLMRIMDDFYSRPCGRGDQCTPQSFLGAMIFLLTPLREGRRQPASPQCQGLRISTHAPAGGAT